MKLKETGPNKNYIGITLKSDDNYNKNNILYIQFLKTYKIYELEHKFLKPTIEKHTTSDGKTYDDLKGNKIIISYSFEDHYIYLYYNKKYKFFNIPWKHYTFKDHCLLNLDKSVFHCINKDDEFYSWEYPNHQIAIFYFRDSYDNELITASCKLERRRWELGIGAFKWLKYFVNTKVSTSLEMDFNKEIGSRKGTWKGGVVGTSIELDSDEDYKDAFKRWCKINNHKYVGINKK